MIPYIFVSSTIEDLNHLRDAIREQISDLGYIPVMSEYGDVGYSPTMSVQDSCYKAVKECHLAVVIIGKKYGSKATDGYSVTHHEFKTMRENNVPVILLIHRDVMSFKKVYEANIRPKPGIKIPGMDNPAMVFRFIDEFKNYEKNNGFIEYANTQTAKEMIKKQLAHIFGDLLSDKHDPIQSTVFDVLSEIKTLNNYLIKEDVTQVKKYTHAVRFLLDKDNSFFANMLEYYSGSLDSSVADSLSCTSFDEYLNLKKIKVTITSNEEINQVLFDTPNNSRADMLGGFFTPQITVSIPKGGIKDVSNNVRYDVDFNRIYLAYNHNLILINQIGKDYFDALFSCIIDFNIEYKRERLTL